MTRTVQWSVYGGSIVAHVVLAFAVERVEARPPDPPAPIAITVREIPPEPPLPPDPPKPPDAPPPPEAEPIEAPELEAPPPDPPKPKPRAPKADAAPASSSSAPMPTFGMSGGSTGTAVPTGSPDGDRENDKPRPEPKQTVKKAKVLDAPKPESADTCTEADTKPKPISMPQPEYTDAARAAGIAGKVRVQVSIDASGKIEKVTVIGPLDPGLDKAAIAAIEKATFEPATKCGKPVAATFKISVKFTL